MSEYVTYTLWRQREERMPRELEQQRVVKERLSERKRERKQEQQPEQQFAVSSEPSVADASEPVAQTSDPERELITR